MMRFMKTFLLVATSVFGAGQSFADTGVWPRTIRHESGDLQIPSRPMRIVSTSPSLTGILLAIDAPVIASAAATKSRLTDDKGFFSQWAKVADERGVEVLYPNLNFDLEAIIGMDPDLLIVSANGGDSASQHYAELTAQKIPTLVVSYANHSWQETATELGKALGIEAEAAVAIARFDADARTVASTIAVPKEPVSIVGYNVGGSYSVARPESAQAQVLELLGFKVSGLPDALQSKVTRRSDFEFISRENMPAAVETDHVFLLSATEEDVNAFVADPLLANRAAVRNGRVHPLGRTSFRIDYYSGRQMIEAVARAFRRP